VTLFTLGEEIWGWILSSALGHKRTFCDVRAISDFHPKADIGWRPTLAFAGTALKGERLEVGPGRGSPNSFGNRRISKQMMPKISRMWPRNGVS
jgi:hypothetical protein